MKKKFLSLLLALLMMVGMTIPVAAYSPDLWETGEPYVGVNGYTGYGTAKGISMWGVPTYCVQNNINLYIKGNVKI